jgi:D-alanyl-D-alanine carboxypeptidase (penicillin-binding protein 5/6)
MAALEQPLFIRIAGAPVHKTQPTTVSGERMLINNNAMLDSGGAYYYEKCIAGCYDSPGERGSGLLSYADNGELALVAVLFLQPADGETGDAAQQPEFPEAIRILDWGFDGFAWQVVLNESDIVVRKDVELADGSGDVALRPASPISVLARTDMTSEDVVKKVVIYAERNGEILIAPISAGTVLGEVTVSVDGRNWGQTKLIAARAVGLNEKQFIKTS